MGVYLKIQRKVGYKSCYIPVMRRVNCETIAYKSKILFKNRFSFPQPPAYCLYLIRHPAEMQDQYGSYDQHRIGNYRFSGRFLIFE